MHYNGYLCELFLELYTKCTINSLHPTMYTCPCTLMNSIQNVMSVTNMGGSIMSFFAPVHVLCDHTISIGVVTCTLAEMQN